MKNILFINTTAKMSGAEFSMLRLMSGLDMEHFYPILLLPESGPFADQADRSGIETVILPQVIRFGEHFRWYKIPKAVRAVCKLFSILRSRQIHLVHVNSPRAAYFGGVAARLAGVPVVIHVRDTHESPFASLFKSRLLGFLSDRIVAVSGAAAAVVLRVNPGLGKKTEVVYNGFDLRHIAETPVADIRAEWGLSATTWLIGSVATIHPSKGQDVLIRALARVHASHPQTRLLLIGEQFHPGAAAYQADLEKLAARSGLADAVIFTGFRHDVPSLIKGLDLFVHPAVIADSLPGALIEAAAAGKAIVASLVGGVPEIIENGKSGIVIEPGDPEKLAQAILVLLSDKTKADQFAEAARERAHGLFPIRMHVERMMAVYHVVMNEKK